MVIAEASVADVVNSARQSLGLPLAASADLDAPLLAALIRRAAGFLCPCSPATLAGNIRESLEYLAADADELAAAIEEAVNAVAIAGDLLELDQVTIEGSAVPATWLFAAPPAFVMSPDGRAFITGCTPDDANPLPLSLSSRIERQGFGRLIRPQPSENLRDALLELGLYELPEALWLKMPKLQDAAELIAETTHRMLAQGPSGSVEGLQILQPQTPVTYYRGRWATPKKETGHFVARRPQEYGADLWGFAALESGILTRFLDFPLKGARWRGCDAAWHLQAAIDHERGAPQRYRRTADDDGYRLDFFSPLPVWAQRRLAILGRSVPKDRCLFSYVMPSAELPAQEDFLVSRVFLAATEDSD